MSKINYAGLQLRIDKSVSTFEFNGQTIEVLNYLPIEDKYDLVMVTLQKSEENGGYNPLKMDMYLHLNMMYLYTNIEFDADARVNEPVTYDELLTSGLLDEFLATVKTEEYDYLYHMLTETKDELMSFKNSAAAVIQNIINDLPKNAAIAKEIVEGFDPTQYQAVVDFAEAANGGRPIFTPVE